MSRTAVVGWALTGLAVVLLGAAVVSAATQPRRPQDEAVAKGPRPYTDQEVTYTSDHGAIKLAGTLSLPNSKGPFPAVLLVAAAGQMTRDEDAEGHKVFVVLADYLLREGVAVLRYDKRGVGASSGNFDKASFADLVADADAGFRYLYNHPEIDRRHIGIIGHSEGGSIGPAVASVDKDVTFVVAMAGSGLSGEFRVINSQVYLAQSVGAPPEQQEAVRKIDEKIFNTVAQTPDDATARDRVAAVIDAALASKAITEDQAKETRQDLRVEFVRTELDDKPIEYLKKVRVPVLALVGTLDKIVPPDPYVKVMQPVIDTIPGSKLQVLPNLNHVMQTARTGSPQEFGTLEETISPVALKTIGNWIAQQVKQPIPRVEDISPSGRAQRGTTTFRLPPDQASDPQMVLEQAKQYCEGIGREFTLLERPPHWRFSCEPHAVKPAVSTVK